jgi:cytochrome bd-type quinol oxidase subunit 1
MRSGSDWVAEVDRQLWFVQRVALENAALRKTETSAGSISETFIALSHLFEVISI